jgi:hypothetical protein
MQASTTGHGILLLASVGNEGNLCTDYYGRVSLYYWRIISRAVPMVEIMVGSGLFGTAVATMGPE